MIQGSKFASGTEAAITAVVRECEDDEIALDALAQWATIPVGKEGGYGIEDNYPIILLNLSKRFNVSGATSTEYIGRLRGYCTQFTLYGADIDFVRAKMLEQLKSDSGKLWRQGMIKRLAESSTETKKLTYLLSVLMRRGYSPKTFEESQDAIQAVYAATFEKPFPAEEKQDELFEVGILNRFQQTTNQTKQFLNAINPIFYTEPLGLNAQDLKIQTSSDELVHRMFEKKKFDQLCFLDEISLQKSGMKNFQSGLVNFVPEKKISGNNGSHGAITPFVLEEIRRDMRISKQENLISYESRVENVLVKLVDENWPDAKLDIVRVKGDQPLWCLTNAGDKKIFVYLTLWVTETQFDSVLSRLGDLANTRLIVAVTNQTMDEAKGVTMVSARTSGELSLICAQNPKQPQSEIVFGRPNPHSSKIVETLTRSLNLSSPIRDEEKNSIPREVVLAQQFQDKSTLPKAFLGSQGGREIYWVPSQGRNPNVGVFGDEGTGKTQLIKRMLLELRKTRTYFLVFDAKGEYLPEDPTNVVFGYPFGEAEIAINPLELNKGNSPSDQSEFVVSCFNSAYGLKEEERLCLWHCLRVCYGKKGFVEDIESTWKEAPPTLKDLRREIEYQVAKGQYKGAAKELLLKIGSCLDHQYFSQPKTKIPFEKLVTSPAVVNLAPIQSEGLRGIIAEFLMAKLPSFAQDDSGEARLFVVADGLHNLFGAGSASLHLLREGRQRGLGIIFSSQNPVDLSELTFTNLGTIVSFKNSDSKNAKTLAAHMGIKEDKSLNKGLSTKFSALAKFSREMSATQFEALPYFQRKEHTSES